MAQKIGTVSLRQGRWPQAGELVIESTAMSLADASIGHDVTLQTPHGTSHRMAVTGVVHDPSVAPAAQQQVVYGYVTPATLLLLGESNALHSLKLSVEPTYGARTLDVIVGVARWLKQSGYTVGEIRVPPRHHPHWGVMSKIVRMLLAFSVLTLLLSALLCATLTTSLLAPQIRQIAIMKTLGARTAQIMMLYSTLIAGIGLIALAIGLPSGIYAGRALASFVAHNQNIELASTAVPTPIYLALAAGGLALPLLCALIPIRIATRRSVREVLNDAGVAMPARRRRTRSSSLFQRLPMVTLAIRNSVRRRARLALTLGLLAAAGALFIASLTISAAWKQSLIDAETERPYNLELEFNNPAPIDGLVRIVTHVPGVRHVEPFDNAAAAQRRPDGLTITSTFPDGGHGRLSLHAVPIGTSFVRPSLIAGRWLSGEPSGAILNGQAASQFPGVSIGDPLQLSVRGRPVALRLVGIVREQLAGATIYISSQTYAAQVGQIGFTGGLRVALQDPSEASEIKVDEDIERALTTAGFNLADATSRSQLGRALAGHVSILIFILIVMSILMGLVGVLGLGGAMATSVLERRRELAVLRAIGAGNAAVQLTVILEAVFIGVLSVMAAVIVSLPLALAVGRIVGVSMMGGPRDVVSLAAVVLWLVIVLLCAVLAGAYPARTASKVTVREALTYY